MGCDVGGLATHSAHWIAVVAVVEEDAGVFLKSLKLLGCACAPTIVVYTFAYSEVLALTADNSSECYCCDNCSGSASRHEMMVEFNLLLEPGDVERSIAGLVS